MDQPLWTPTRWAWNGDVRLAFDTWIGADEGEPLLLIMGLGVSRPWWPDGLCRTLAGHGFAVARYDQRDAGESTHLPPTKTRLPVTALLGRRGEAYTAEDMTDDAVGVLDALGWESAHLFGVSLGGAVAQRVAVRHPDRVRTLTSMSAVPGDTAGMGTLRYIHLPALARLARLKFPDTEEGHIQAGLAIARFCASPGHPFDEREARARAERLADAGTRDTQAQSRQIGAQWHGPAISTITAPTEVLHGQDDPLIRPRAGAGWSIPSTVELLPDSARDLVISSRPTATRCAEPARGRGVRAGGGIVDDPCAPGSAPWSGLPGCPRSNSRLGALSRGSGAAESGGVLRSEPQQGFE